MLQEIMNIPHLMVHAQQDLKEKVKRNSIDSKRERYFDDNTSKGSLGMIGCLP